MMAEEKLLVSWVRLEGLREREDNGSGLGKVLVGEA